MKSIFTPLKDNGFTTLKIRYDYKTDKIKFFCAKEWENDLDFKRYNTDFDAESILTDEAIYMNTEQVKELYEKYDLTDYLEEVTELLRKGKHYGMECYYNAKHNIRFMCNQHSRKLGINNLYQATMAGGIRRHGFEDEEIDVIIDGLNLGRAMSFKNIAAGINFGGCKTTVHMDPLNLDDLDVLGFLAFAIDRSRTMTGPDMNFPTEMADIINEHFSLQYTSGPSSPLGESGKPTAFGTYLSLKEAVKFKTGKDSLAGMSIAIQGLGAVGRYMAEHFLSENVKLYVTDINADRVEELIKNNPQSDIIHVKEDILKIEADIFCPCAIGGIIHEENIKDLKFKYIFGPANNQLRASSQEEEIKLSKLLDEKGILFVTEWWHNAAGVMSGEEHYVHGKNASYDNLLKKIEETLPKKTLECLIKSKELGITPCEYVYKECENIIYG